MIKKWSLIMTDIEKEIKVLKAAKWLNKDYEISEDIISCINVASTPAKKDIFNAFKIGESGNIITPEDVRILIIGQDPYPDSKRAHGLAFSFANGEDSADDSLLNIFKAIKAYKDKTNFDSIFNEDITGKNDENKRWNTNLEVWAKNNGVLLLNTALTYEQTELYKDAERKTKQQKKEIDNAQKKIYTKHKNVWKNFFNNIITTLLTYNNKKFVVFLWGRKAEKAYYDAIKNLKIKKDLLVLTTSHPSPQGVKYGFKNDAPNHFKACDEFLKDKVWLNFPENNKLD